MSGNGSVRRTAAYAFASAVLGSALAVVINLATEWKHSWAAWVGVAVLTVLTAGTSLLVTRGSRDSANSNELRFGRRLRAGRIRVRGQRNVLDVGDNARIDDIDFSAGDSSGSQR